MYKSGLAYSPVVLFFAMVFLWVVGFPWYLVVRHRILCKQASLSSDEEVYPLRQDVVWIAFATLAIIGITVLVCILGFWISESLTGAPSR